MVLFNTHCLVILIVLVWSKLNSACIFKNLKLKHVAAVEEGECSVHDCASRGVRRCVFDFTVREMDVNGRRIHAVNGGMPGTEIRVCEGDVIAVRVANELGGGEGVVIHWHGLHQRATPYMDGAMLVTQCPIPPGGEPFTYEFRAAPRGTHWYHAHYGTQAADGLFGPLVVLPRTAAATPRDHVLMLQDWLAHNETFAQRWVRHEQGNGSHLSDGILVNGRGDGSPYGNEIPEFEVTRSEPWLFRIIHAGALSSPVRLTVDEHFLEVVATDGADIQPVNVTAVVLFPGERYDVILHLAAHGGGFKRRYVMRWDGQHDAEGLKQHSVLTYGGSGGASDNVVVVTEPYTPPAGIQLLELNPVHDKRGADTMSVSALRSATDDADIDLDTDFTGNSKLQFYVEMDFNEVQPKSAPQDMLTSNFMADLMNYLNPNGSTMVPSASHVAGSPVVMHHMHKRHIDPKGNPRGGGKYSRFQEAPGRLAKTEVVTQTEAAIQGDLAHAEPGMHHFSVPQMNDISYQHPNLTLLGDSSPLLCDADTVKDEHIHCETTMCRCVHMWPFPYDRTVEVVIVDKGSMFEDAHPMHLHGHHFSVVALGKVGHNTSRAEVEQLDREGRIPRVRHRAVMKDTVAVPDGGYAIIRFRTNNIGYWLFHCHLIFHMLQGMMMGIKVGEFPPASIPHNMPPCHQPAGHTGLDEMRCLTPPLLDMNHTSSACAHVGTSWYYDHKDLRCHSAQGQCVAHNGSTSLHATIQDCCEECAPGGQEIDSVQTCEQNSQDGTMKMMDHH